MRLAAWSFMLSTASIANTRRADSNGVRVAAATTGSSMSATSISAAPEGRTHVRSGWLSRATRSATVPGLRAPSASSAAANARATVRLPVPGGPWNRYACEGVAPGANAGVRTARAWGWASRPGNSGAVAGWESVWSGGSAVAGMARHRRGRVPGGASEVF